MGVIAGTFKYSVGIQSGPNIEEILERQILFDKDKFRV